MAAPDLEEHLAGLQSPASVAGAILYLHEAMGTPTL